MLFSQLKGIIIRTDKGHEKGKINNIIIDIDKWTIDGIEVSTGLLKEQIYFPVDVILELDPVKKILLIDDEGESIDSPVTDDLPLALASDILSMKVITLEGEDVGKLYDFDIATKLKHWKVWKLLIKTGFNQRRLRISPTEVHDMTDRIVIDALVEDSPGPDDE